MIHRHHHSYTRSRAARCLLTGLLTIAAGACAAPPVATKMPSTVAQCPAPKEAATPASPASIGTATMDAQDVITFRIHGQYVNQGNGMVVWKYTPGSPGYSHAMERVSGIKPGEHKGIPPYPDVGDSASWVTMESNGDLTVRLMSHLQGGVTGEGMLKIKPTDPDYQKIIDKLCGLKPGQTKMMPEG